VDIATQEILTIAEEVNKDRHKTLKILTKLDLINKKAKSLMITLLKG